MNLLAHAYLSPVGGEVMVGNVVADWVKGKVRREVGEGVRVGFELHRRIDGFADAHAGMGRAAGALEPKWGRYAAVLADVLFDHVLAAGWERYSAEPLEVFTGRVYGELLAARGGLPAMANHAICAMVADDWLTGYRTLDGMRVALTRMSARLRHGVERAPAVADFCACRPVFVEAFEELFGALVGEFLQGAGGFARKAS
jgi:acyl carrier protein phosphodiesterase